jgi:hypothetical protein
MGLSARGRGFDGAGTMRESPVRHGVWFFIALQHAEPSEWSQFIGAGFSLCEHNRFAARHACTVVVLFVNLLIVFLFSRGAPTGNGLLIH